MSKSKNEKEKKSKKIVPERLKKKRKGETFKREFWFIAIPFSIVLLFICSFPYWITQYSLVSFDLSKHGGLGDTINGLIAPFVAIIAAMLTFIAFWVQYAANKQQRDDIELERFETRFFELIRLHRQNVEEIDIAGKVYKRKAIAALYDEFRFIYFFLETQASQFIFTDKDKSSRLDLSIDDKEKMSIVAYLIFFYGIGIKSNPAFFDSIVPYCSVEFIHKLAFEISKLKSEYRKTRYISVKLKNAKKNIYKGKYTPFEGHSGRLGHYFRHLFQSVKFVNEAPALEDEIERYNYVKMLRAQLSDYEQVMLYYNSLSPMGQPWLNEEKPLLIKYKMVKNMPLHLVKAFGLDPEIKFKEEIELLHGLKPPEELFESREFEKKINK